jgi:hypothetical protein
MFRQKDVTGIATVHHPLRDVHPSASDVCPIIDIRNLIDRTAVNSHPQLNTRMISQCLAYLQRTARWLFRTTVKQERHPVTGRHSGKLAACFRCPETFCCTDELIQLLQ